MNETWGYKYKRQHTTKVDTGEVEIKPNPSLWKLKENRN